MKVIFFLGKMCSMEKFDSGIGIYFRGLAYFGARYSVFFFRHLNTEQKTRNAECRS
ncbi:hypothetical protein BH09BAC3_BH09BAC3_13300 [soil metagenome]